ncbi:glycerol-3-phosphate 1-O-acyltransferase PlsY [Leuconostocaceae bacterium ESL0958]|nr:glycerol-3-phosphate 1-O-acyltransferase PlsY [Leuconostocaceae bacterium ESL0958]
MSQLILMIGLSYLLGALMPGYWLGKYVYHKNIQNEGSGNIGTSNAFRILGPVPGVIVMILDILKGSAAAALPWLFHSNANAMLIGLAAIVGHTYSIFLHFKGGKAVATSVGVVAVYNFPVFLVAWLAFLLGLFLFSRVSIASMAGFLFASLWCLLVAKDPILSVIAVVLTIFVFYRHRSNIQRILAGTEATIPFGCYYWAKHKS